MEWTRKVIPLMPGTAFSSAESASRQYAACFIQLKENDTVEIFAGPQPLPERIISSADFARNLTQLAEYVRESGSPSIAKRFLQGRFCTRRRPDRLIFTYAARDMVLRIGRGRSDGSASGGTNSQAQISSNGLPER